MDGTVVVIKKILYKLVIRYINKLIYKDKIDYLIFVETGKTYLYFIFIVFLIIHKNNFGA